MINIQEFNNIDWCLLIFIILWIYSVISIDKYGNMTYPIKKLYSKIRNIKLWK